MSKINETEKLRFGLFEVTLLVLPVFFIIADFIISVSAGYVLDPLQMGQRYAFYLAVWIIVSQIVKNADDATRMRIAYINSTSQSSNRESIQR